VEKHGVCDASKVGVKCPARTGIDRIGELNWITMLRAAGCVQGIGGGW
jgi:hypothetical protein